MVARHGPASRSAAFRKIAARSSHRVWAHHCCASTADSIAIFTSAGPAWCTLASTLRWSCGEVTSMVFPVRISFPPMTRGISITEAPSSASLALRAAFSGEFGA